MKVITTKGDRVTFQHFIDEDYRTLLEFERQSWARALETSEIISIGGGICEFHYPPVFMLTVKDVKI